MRSPVRLVIAILVLLGSVLATWFAIRAKLPETFKPTAEAQVPKFSRSLGAQADLDYTVSTPFVSPVAELRAQLAVPSRLIFLDPLAIDYSIPLVTKYDSLVALAEAGHADAALELALGVGTCASIPTSAAELASAVDRVEQTRMVEGY